MVDLLKGGQKFSKVFYHEGTRSLESHFSRGITILLLFGIDKWILKIPLDKWVLTPNLKCRTIFSPLELE